ncbi:hypothetical protein FFLO_00672 [Filobasidium floriforme]|uniref:Uncharacterized protein n=1 Tax=Filobasidium floriforme TaxID=5210 RepID=A0A8K0JQY1_9TREE|nr:Erg28 like protein-domain-containing protein [Filobasidium floriforme]KAG7571320.1 hypothetical protein FFLO_00672 [Filobasidium floriforme]KAH8086270.1 Erg28 like protein-domain-containing protein [Filobasidium floriforme]
MANTVVPIPTLVQGKSSLYNHSDPLIRRLRLEDPYGRPIDSLREVFLGKEVVIFYIGSMHGNDNLTDLNKDLVNLALAQPKTCSVIYVSVDSTQTAIELVAKNKPFLRMSLLDSSDFAVMESQDNLDKKKRVAMDEVLRDEDFITGEEYGAGGVNVPFGKEDDASEYVRPLSRAAITQLTHSYGTPALAVYHIPSHRFISTNTRRSQFRADRIGINYKQWLGGSKKTGLGDVWDLIKVPVAVVVGGVGYTLIRLFKGEEWNVVPQIFSNMQLAGPDVHSPPPTLIEHAKSAFVLPQASNGGYLPYWLAFVAVVSVYNTIQAFVTPTLTKRIYSRKPEEVTGIGRRTFGVWTLLAACIRIYAAYEINNPALYNLTLASYVLAGGHFLSELFIFKSAGLQAPALSPVLVAIPSMIWLVMQRQHYLSV